MNLLDLRPGKRYLDLGTGNGYLAFEMASRFPEIKVTGIDIAINSIRVDQKLAREKSIANLNFLSYGGIQLPFKSGAVDGAISRYAFHHFPDPDRSVQELSRVTAPGGFVILSDPMTYAEDRSDFIDQFQKLKPDGHVHFYREEELDSLFEKFGLIKETGFKKLSIIPSGPPPVNPAELLDSTKMSSIPHIYYSSRPQSTFNLL